MGGGPFVDLLSREIMCLILNIIYNQNGTSTGSPSAVSNPVFTKKAGIQVWTVAALPNMKVSTSQPLWIYFTCLPLDACSQITSSTVLNTWGVLYCQGPLGSNKCLRGWVSTTFWSFRYRKVVCLVRIQQVSTRLSSWELFGLWRSYPWVSYHTLWWPR